MDNKVFGVGIYRKGKYNSRHKAYSFWCNMLNRCYNPAYQLNYPTYIGCSVCTAWLEYQVFAEWFNNNWVNSIT